MLVNSWFNPPDGPSFDKPYADVEAWAAVGRAVEREFTKLREVAQAAALVHTSSGTSHTLTDTDALPDVVSKRTVKRKRDAKVADTNVSKRSRKGTSSSRSAEYMNKRRSRPGPAARARRRVLNLAKKNIDTMATERMSDVDGVLREVKDHHVQTLVIKQ
jgi:hypothetical protein